MNTEIKCSTCEEMDNLHINYNYELPTKPIESVLCNECGEMTYIIEEKKNPNALTHGITPSAPASLKPVEIDKWVGKVTPTFKHYYQERYDDLVRQYEQLANDYAINKMCYEASIGFEPNMGQVYHLYRKRDGSTFISLVEPQYAYFGEFIGSYRLNAQYAWEEV